MKKIISLLLLIFLCGNLFACSAQNFKRNDMAEVQESPSQTDADFITGSAATGSAAETDFNNRKIIKEATLSAKTENFDTFFSLLKEQTTETGGYIQNISTLGENKRRSAEFILRIPADKFDTFINQISNAASISHYQESLSDVTLAYADTESRIKALRTEQETLISLLEKAETLDSVIQLQDRLSELRAEIESYESQKKLYDNQISYSTLQIYVQEVERISGAEEASAGFWQEIAASFSDNLYHVGSGLRNFIIWLIGTLPYWFPLAAIGISLFLIIRHTAKKKKQPNSEKEPKQNNPQ